MDLNTQRYSKPQFENIHLNKIYTNMIDQTMNCGGGGKNELNCGCGSGSTWY